MTQTLPAAPPRAARDRAWDRVDFAALDFETTGLSSRRDRAVSFGAAPVRSGRVVVGGMRYELLDPGASPSADSVLVHGLRSIDLARALPPSEAAAALRSALDGCVVLVWHAPIELECLVRVFRGGRRRFARRIVDVRELAIEADRQAGKPSPRSTYSLGRAAERHCVPVAAPHHALDDALVTAQLFLVLVAHLRRGGEPVRLGELMRISRRPVDPWTV